MNIQGRALIVDDNAVNAWVATRLLAKLGWATGVAVSGEAGLAALAEQQFDLVLLDLRMPGMSGMTVCERIRRELGLEDLFIAAYTAHCSEQDFLELSGLGFNALLIKPTTVAELRRLCERVRNRSALTERSPTSLGNALAEKDSG